MLKISVAMCTYNGEQFLGQQLESIAAQTVKPDELVIIDDASSDRTLLRLQDFASRVPFPVTIHINTDNVGSTPSFEKAVRRCTGEIIVLCDQDDVWLPHKLKLIRNTFEMQPHIDYVFSDADLVDANLVAVGQTLWESFPIPYSFFQTSTTIDQFHNFLLRPHFITGATMAFRSSLKEVIFPFPIETIWLHDAWIAIVASAAGAQGFALKEKLVLYRIHSKQQVGVAAAGKTTFGTRYTAFKNQKTLRVRKWLELSRSFGLLQSHLAQHKEQYQYVTTSLPLIQEVAVHSHNRASINSARWYLKHLLLFREALSGRYSKYGNGFKSVLCYFL